MTVERSTAGRHVLGVRADASARCRAPVAAPPAPPPGAPRAPGRGVQRRSQKSARARNPARAAPPAPPAGHARPQTLEARGRLWRGPFGLELAVLALARRSCRGVPPPAPPRRLRDGGLRGLARFRGRGPASKGVGGWTGEAPARREVRLAAQVLSPACPSTGGKFQRSQALI